MQRARNGTLRKKRRRDCQQKETHLEETKGVCARGDRPNIPQNLQESMQNVSRIATKCVATARSVPLVQSLPRRRRPRMEFWNQPFPRVVEHASPRKPNGKRENSGKRRDDGRNERGRPGLRQTRRSTESRKKRCHRKPRSLFGFEKASSFERGPRGLLRFSSSYHGYFPGIVVTQRTVRFVCFQAGIFPCSFLISPLHAMWFYFTDCLFWGVFGV